MLRILLGCCSFLPFRGPGTEAVAPSSSSEFCYMFVAKSITRLVIGPWCRAFWDLTRWKSN